MIGQRRLGTSLAASSVTTIGTVLDLYDANRFLDAYAVTRAYWTGKIPLLDLKTEELVHGARLAGRLGGIRVQSWLLRKAAARDPENPLVRYFARGLSRARWTVLDALEDFERQPVLGANDPAWEASWLASNASLYARTRDFGRAHALLDQAAHLNVERAWVVTCKAEVLFLEERWNEALDAATEAWRRSIGMPGAAWMLGRVLAQLGRSEEAVERLAADADDGQSYEILLTLVRHVCAVAERATEEARKAWALRADELLAGAPKCMPLADRISQLQVALCRFDVAILLDDRERVRREAEELPFPYFRTVAENLIRNPLKPRVILPHRAVFQKRAACLPASIASLAGDADISEDAVAAAITYDGTAVWRAVAWLRKRGFAVKSFVATPGLSATLLKRGVPFVYLTRTLENAHACAAIGLDESSGTLIVHDPSNERWGRILIDRMNEEEAPFGPEALAFVPSERAALLDCIPDAESAPEDLRVAYEESLQTQGARVAETVIRRLSDGYASHPLTRRLQELQLGYTGRVGEAIPLQEELLSQYPNCVLLRHDMLTLWQRTGDQARIRQTLEDIVERRRHPGIQQSETWVYAPTPYVVQYADYLGVTALHYRKAERLLRLAMIRNPGDASAYHVLGDVFLREGRFADSVLPLRIAAIMADENDHYARSAADALRRGGRENEALELLRGRVARLGAKVEGHHAWITWVDALEDYGHPDEAIAALTEAQATRSSDPEIHAFAAKFWIRMGHWDRAQAAMEAVCDSQQKALQAESATYFHHAAGRWETALDCCEQWIHQCPEDIRARQQYLSLLACKEGRAAALARAEQWTRERKGHDDFEMILYDELTEMFRGREAEELIRTRLQRNPHDAWAQRELGHLVLGRAELRIGDDRTALLTEAEKVIARCDEVCPDVAATLALKARLAECRGRREEAIELLFRALVLQSDFGYCYDRIWQCAYALPAEAQRRIRERIEEHVTKSLGRLFVARGQAFAIAERFGVKEAEEALSVWGRSGPDDPTLIEAQADLLLTYGQGRTDAERAVALLEPAILRFPNHTNLRLSLAHAFHVLVRDEEETATLREALRHHPRNNSVRNTLASVLARRGEKYEAIRVLEDGPRVDPLDVSAWRGLAVQLWNQGRHSEARAALERGLARLPESVYLRESLVHLLQDLGEGNTATAVAREGAELFPEGAYCWHMLARALERSASGTDLGAIETAYGKALECNALLQDAAIGLAETLTRQRRFEEARAVIEAQAPYLPDPGPTRAHLAGIMRQEGKGDEAVREMMAVLKQWPLMPWAWSWLMDWLEADEKWGHAKEVLADMPPAILDQPEVRARRLMLLRRAGTPDGELDPQWERLLSDFPREETVHLWRFDSLRERGDWNRAAEVLAEIEKFAPQSAYVLARKVQFLAHSGDEKAAIQAAMTVWQLPHGKGDTWPDETAWRGLADARWAKPAAQALLDKLLEGGHIRLQAFRHLVQEILLVRWRLPVTVSLHPDYWAKRGRQARRLRQLLGFLDGVPWDAGIEKAIVLDIIRSLGRRRLALRYWRSHKDACRRQTDVWQQMGSILCSERFSDRRRARVWLSDWREHQGVEMWAVANYSLSLRKFPRDIFCREHLDELYATSRDVLERLPHDSTARYHAATLCEAAIRLGRQAEFLEYVTRHDALLRDENREHWMPGLYEALPRVLLRFRDLLKENDRAKVMALS
jgi:tetratricopeptide (TPR) repeat protein